MSGKTAVTQQATVPLSIVLITLGSLIVLGVLAIWVLAPGTMPATVYRTIEPYLPQEGPIPTRMALAILPEIAAENQPEGITTILVPESSVAETYPDYFVSAAEAVVADPRAGQPTRIVIPAIGLDADVVEVNLEQVKADDGESYYQWQVPTGYMAGWHSNSARLGTVGNTVLNGHHNIYGEVFRSLVDLEAGDEITIYDKNRAYNYHVTDKEILPERGEPLEVRLENAKWIEPTADERITLITCWPYTNNTHRLVIVAQPNHS